MDAECYVPLALLKRRKNRQVELSRVLTEPDCSGKNWAEGMTALLIEAIGKEDLEELGLLYQDLTGEAADLEKMAQTFQWMNVDPDYILLGAKLDDQLAGSLMGIICYELLGPCRPFMVVENVIVGGRFRRQGIGKALMEAIEAVAREKGCYLIQLVSSGHRKEAHQFYESMGYGTDPVRGFRKFL
jgi:GNAT superfamily N-acetyltransferase